MNRRLIFGICVLLLVLLALALNIAAMAVPSWLEYRVWWRYRDQKYSRFIYSLFRRCLQNTDNCLEYTDCKLYFIIIIIIYPSNFLFYNYEFCGMSCCVLFSLLIRLYAPQTFHSRHFFLFAFSNVDPECGTCVC